MSLQELLSLVEMAGRYLSSEQRRDVAQQVLRLAGEARRPATDVERARTEREIGRQF